MAYLRPFRAFGGVESESDPSRESVVDRSHVVSWLACAFCETTTTPSTFQRSQCVEPAVHAIKLPVPAP
jgi:hypothetical protein